MIVLPVVGAILFLLVLVLTTQRRAERAVRGAAWIRTEDVFEDPRSGRTVRVWIDPGDGSTHYVPERPRPARETGK
jgi:hypothetical protein